jgi:hypothetical protein
MSKKVRYAIGAIGVAPALGMLAHVPAAATHTPGKTAKTVSLNPNTPPGGCTGRDGHGKALSPTGLSLTFWSTPNGGRTCIGTIEGLAASPGFFQKVAVYVSRAGHIYCFKSAVSHVTEPCHTSFTRPFSVVARSSLGTHAVVKWRV